MKGSPKKSGRNAQLDVLPRKSGVSDLEVLNQAELSKRLMTSEASCTLVIGGACKGERREGGNQKTSRDVRDLTDLLKYSGRMFSFDFRSKDATIVFASQCRKDAFRFHLSRKAQAVSVKNLQAAVQQATVLGRHIEGS